MAKLLIIHDVEDYDRWRPFFDEHQSKRRAAGLTDLNVWRSKEDPNRLLMLYEVASLDRAKAFAESDDLKEIMGKAGVIGRPEAIFLDDQPVRTQAKSESRAPSA